MAEDKKPILAVAVLPAAVFLLTLLLGLALAAGWTWRDLSRQVSQDQRDIEQELVDSYRSSSALLSAVTAAYQSFETFDAARLSVLLENILESHDQLEMFAFCAWVPEMQRQAFMARMHTEGFPNFQVSNTIPLELGDGSRGFLPARFVEPYSPWWVRYLGTDLSAGRGLHGTLRELVDSAEALVLPGWQLPGRRPGSVYLAKATYRGLLVPATQAERRKQFSGAFLMALDLPGILEHIERRFPDYRISGNWKPPSEADGSLLWHDNGQVWLQRRFYPLGPQYRVELTRAGAVRELLSPVALASVVIAALIAALVAALWRRRMSDARKAEIAERDLQMERQRAHSTLTSMSDAVLVTDTGWLLTDLNPVAEKLLQVQGTRVIGRPLTDQFRLVSQDAEHRDLDTYDHVLRLLSARPVPDVLLQQPDDTQVPVDVRASRLQGAPGGIVLLIRDVSVERELTRELAYHASHDLLTGLLNRNAFEIHMNAALESTRTQHQEHAFLFIDLDRFKLVNDTCGHLAGDELLKMIANLFRAELRESDVLARLGGDEFGVLQMNCSVHAAMDLAGRLHQGVEKFRFIWQGRVFDIRASLGVVPITVDSSGMQEIMAAGDLACHAAKEGGRNTIHFSEQNDAVVRGHRQQMQWLPELRDALDNNQFMLFSQQIVPLQDDGGLRPMREILLRLARRDDSLVLPGVFLPSAERYDLMGDLDRWVLEKAVRTLAGSNYEPDMSFSINLSGQSLGNAALADWLEALCRHHKLPTARICLEITETAAISNLGTAEKLISRLRRMGFRIMLDDFGSGLSSFNYLSNLTVDFIKIDGQFIRQAPDDPLAKSMIRMIVEIARVLGIHCIAEMIENERAMNLARELGVDYAQGFHIERPTVMPQQSGVYPLRLAGD